MNLDTLAGFFCLIIAFATFVVEIVTSSKRWVWITLPRYVRTGLFLTGGAMLYRGVNLLNMARRPTAYYVLGHVNVEAVISAAFLAYTMCALAVWVISRNGAAIPTAAEDELHVPQD